MLYEYANAQGEEVAQPRLIADGLEALLPFWSGRLVNEINRQTCADYVRWRCAGGLREHMLNKHGKSCSGSKISRSTARRDLGILRAALNFARSDGLLNQEPPKVTLPAETAPRDRALSRKECAKILYELWRGAPTRARDGSVHRSPGKTRHAARLFWLLLYTGSRFNTVAKTTWEKRDDGPWLELTMEIWHRRGSKEKATKKLRNDHRIPGRIRLALDRWKRMFPSSTYVVEHPRRPNTAIQDIGQALDGACKRLGIERITPHTIKHTAITLFISGGGDPLLAAEYFSTSFATIQKNYLHLAPDHQAPALVSLRRLGKRQPRKS